MSKMTKTSYPTAEAAALGGFRRILLNYSRWTDVEFGFLVLEVKSEVVRQLGHEGFLEIQKRYHYTEPETKNKKEANEVDVPVYELPSLRAYCHTHPNNDGFSSTDFGSFKKLKRLIKDKKLEQELVFYLMSVNQQVRQSRTEESFLPGTNVSGLEKATP
jgi:hypothetical protein